MSVLAITEQTNLLEIAEENINLLAVQETQTNILTELIPGQTGAGLPAGGTTGQVAAKASNSDYDVEWIDAADGAAALAPIPFEFNNASPRVVHTLTADALVLSVALSITEAFNGDAPTIQIGTPAAPELLMNATDSDVTKEIDFENDCFEQLPGGAEIIITTTPGAGATAGAGFLILEIVNL